MGKIFMLAAANIRKSKSQAVSLLLFTFIAAMFLNIGLVMYFGLGAFFDERAEQLNAPHFSVVQSAFSTTDEQLQYLEEYPGVIETEKQAVMVGIGDYFIGGSKTQGTLSFTRADERQHMNPPSLIGDSLLLTGDAIYIPYFMMLDGGYTIGDDFSLIFEGSELHFTVAGATEEIMFGALLNGFYRFYISDERFYELEQRFTDNQSFILSARLNEKGRGLQLDADYTKKFFYAQDAEDSLGGMLFHIAYDSVKTARTMIPMISTLIITAFAIILLAISLIIIRFRISNSVEEGMVNIGVLKAMGYRNGQIMISIVGQFGSIAFAGSLLGIGLSQMVIPIVTKLLKSQIALVWNPDFDSMTAGVSLMFVLLAVLSVSFLSVQRIKRLHPLTALRSGISTHNFKKNTLPLDKAQGSLILLLAMKQLMKGKRQAAMITITIAAVAFAAVIGISIHYNMSVKRDAFIRAIVGEIPEAVFLLKDNKDTLAFKKRMSEHSEVRKAFGFQNGISLLAGETDVNATAVEDCSLLEGSMLIDGRYPKHSNEIALGTAIAKLKDKQIGDMITVKSGANEKDYLITGIVQIMNNYGFNMVLTGDALREIQPDFEFNAIYVYLISATGAREFVKNIKETDDSLFSSVIEIQEQTKAQFGSMGSIFAVIAAGILCITVMVVVLVLYMVIKTTILRRWRELGVQKALGFTTVQLMNQIAFHFMPTILLGVTAGAVGGYYSLNPLFVMLTSSSGIVRAELISPLHWIAITCIVLIALAYCVSMLIARRISKISAYSLLNE